MRPCLPISTVQPTSVEAVETLPDAVMAGEPGRSRVGTFAETAWAIRDRYADTFPLPPDRTATILEDLGDRLGAIMRLKSTPWR